MSYFFSEAARVEHLEHVAYYEEQQQASPAEVAHQTIQILRRTVPAAVASVNFLFGGQTPEEAMANLDAMNRLGPQPWQLSFSYGCALLEPALRAWQGQAAHARSSQDALLERARLNSAACQAQYTAAMEAAGPESRLA